MVDGLQVADEAVAAGKRGMWRSTTDGNGEGGGRVAIAVDAGVQQMCGSDEGYEQKATTVWGGRRGNNDGSGNRQWGGEG
ncbi:hypothetical protein OPV22_032901 [Ensete ventricosum]|uniref:Uncharacterized protein n=1 Tax=Ensete ventricosum TaxID=4639 RepID=A0AAV8PYK5_ENSVE|nr:hypothetical protein OPV22_032901 [Ensete ventricosum]